MEVRDSLHFMYRVTPGLLLLAFAATVVSGSTTYPKTQPPLEEVNLVPYPQKVTIKPGTLTITSLPAIHLLPGAGAKEILGQEQLASFFHKRISSAETAERIRIELGSLKTGRVSRLGLIPRKPQCCTV